MLVGKKILIVEDSKTVRSIISKVFSGQGCEVQTAINGVDAIKKIQHFRPDLITTDVDMPHMDGYEFCTYIRSGQDPDMSEEVSQTPIMVITATDTYGTREKWFQFGAAEFILKPFQPSELIEAATKVLEPEILIKNLTVLIAEDNILLRNMFSGIISNIGVNVLTAEDGKQALDMINDKQNKIDLLFTDYEMPRMDGLELCKLVRNKGFDKPIIFLTAQTGKDKVMDAFNHGATDYLIKPFLKEELLARVRVHLANHALKKEQKRLSDILETKVVGGNKKLLKNQTSALHVLMALIENRDPETSNHTIRTQKYIEVLLNELVKFPEFQEQFGLDDISEIAQASPLHDVGKMGIPDAILLKPGKLTDEEFDVMKEHALLGEAAFKSGEQSSFMKHAAEIAGNHHEKWDGSGYPRGLAGEAIPLSARLMALADVYDALRSKRVYKAAMLHEEARVIILEGKGKHFDPLLVDLFIQLEDDFQLVAKTYAD